MRARRGQEAGAGDKRCRNVEAVVKMFADEESHKFSVYSYLQASARRRGGPVGVACYERALPCERRA